MNSYELSIQLKNHNQTLSNEEQYICYNYVGVAIATSLIYLCYYISVYNRDQ